MAGACAIDQESQQFTSQEEEVKNYGDSGIESALKEGVEILKKVRGVDKRLYEKFKREYEELYQSIKKSFDNDQKFSQDERDKIRKELEDLRRLSSNENIWDLTKTKDVHFILELLKDKDFPKNTHFEYFDDEVNLGETISNFEGEDLVKLYKGVPNFERNMLIVINNDDTETGKYILEEFIKKIKPIDQGITGGFERKEFEKGKIPDLGNLKKLLASGNYAEIHKKILLKTGELGMSKDPKFKTEVVDVIVDFFDKNPGKSIDDDMKDFIKFFDCNSPKHVKLAKRIQEILLRDIKNGLNVIGDTYLLSFSIKSGFPLTKEVIKKELGNISETIKKLGVEIDNGRKNSNIGYYAHFLSIISGYVEGNDKDFLKKTIDGLYKIHYEMSSIGGIENFKLKLNNSPILEKKLTKEELDCLDYNTIGGFLKSIKPYLKDKNINENNFDELINVFEQINRAQKNELIGALSQENKDILEKGKILSKNINGEYSIDDKILKEIITDFKLKSKDNDKLDLKTLINEKLKEKGIISDEKLVSFIEKQVEVEKNLQEVKKIKEDKEYRKLYISYANGEISDKEFETKKTEIEEKTNNSHNTITQEGKLFNSIEYTQNDNGSYEIGTGREGEKLELSYDEFEELKDNEEALVSFIDFYKGLKDDGLDFVWKYRDFFFKNIDNFNLNSGINLETEGLSIYNIIGKQIGLKWEKLDDSKKYFRDLNSKGGMINGEFVEPVTTKLISSDTSTIFNYLKNKLGRFDEKNILLETTW